MGAVETFAVGVGGVFDDGVVDIAEGADILLITKNGSAAQGECLVWSVEDHLNAAHEGEEAQASDTAAHDGEKQSDEFAIEHHRHPDTDEDQDESAEQDRHDPRDIGEDQLVRCVASDLHGLTLRSTFWSLKGARVLLAREQVRVLHGV